ncbi:MAG TPA: STAS domain-containing protein [Phycisphaerae bacterium]|nr:STAS domain-containing protein [Phycisphaerae bacterium]
MILASLVSSTPDIPFGSSVRLDRCGYQAGAEQPTGLDLICLTIGEREAVCRFADTGAILLEIPATFERQMAGLFRRCAERLRGKRLVFDLCDVPAISSRQLGMLLVVRRISPSSGVLVLRRVSANVRRVLEKACLLDWFEIEPVAVHN